MEFNAKPNKKTNNVTNAYKKVIEIYKDIRFIIFLIFDQQNARIILNVLEKKK